MRCVMIMRDKYKPRYHLTPSKVFNYCALLFSKKAKLTTCLGMPTRLFVEITNECNLKCGFCATGLGILKRDKYSMDFALFKRIIDHTYPYLLEINFSGYGEPLLNKDLVKMVSYAKNKGIRVWFPTNLLLLSEGKAIELVESGLDQITVSLDSSHEESYLKHKRAGSFSKTIENLKMLSRVKKDLHRVNPQVKVNFVVMKHNQNEIEAARDLAQESGVDIFMLKPVNMWVSGYGEVQIKDEMDIEQRGVYKLKDKELNSFKCPWVWNTVMIFADGSISPCCFDAHGSIKLGNITHDSLKKVWNNNSFMLLREKLTKDPDSIALCQKCPTKYKYEF